MEKRRKPRQQRRLTCELWLEGRRHGGILRDVSEVGLYVQTRAKAAPGSELELVFKAERAQPELRVQARVARAERLAAHFSSAGAGGLGLEILHAIPGLEGLLASAGFTGASPAVAAEIGSLRAFRVKLREIRGARVQTVAVQAPSVQAARSRALARAGAGWKIAEVCDA